MKKVEYEFSSEETVLTEKVLIKLEKKLQREKVEQPGASLWIENPTLVADVQALQTRLINRVTKVTTTELVARLLKRAIENTITIHPEKWLKLLYDVSSTGMKRLHLKIANGLK
ncbi:MAG: hypothetical protein EOP45_07855 [Sphingobacteriaceae bacterium]|nr:MAG: hypothetical protein EOP45_07855 [Sphingobacteriaceae bacterium]